MFKPNILAAATAVIAIVCATTTPAQEASPAPEFDSFASTKTRAEVIAATQEAARRGLIPRNEADTQRLVTQGFKSTKSRAQVRAETLEAVRLGLVQHGEAGAPEATPQQVEQIRMAGLRAARSEQVAARD